MFNLQGYIVLLGLSMIVLILNIVNHSGIVFISAGILSCVIWVAQICYCLEKDNDHSN